MKDIRLRMLKDSPIPECVRCYELDASGVQSMRKEQNKVYLHHFDKVESTSTNGSVAKLNMPYMDIRFSNICNLRCRTCGPDLSSKWFKDAEALKMPLNHHSAIVHPTEDPEVLWRQVEELLPTVEQIYFAGGEPLIMEEHYKILSWLVLHKRFDVELRYNTNFSVTNFQGQDVFEIWKLFNKVEVGASLDAFGDMAEYARKDTDWKMIVANRQRMLEVCPEVHFYVSCTLSVFSFMTMPEFHRDWVTKKLIDLNAWNINPLTYPLHYKVHVTPEAFRENVIEKYLQHIDWLKSQVGISNHILERWQAAVTFLKGPQLKEQIPEFKNITRKLDRIRNESFGNVFPEMAFILNE